MGYKRHSDDFEEFPCKHSRRLDSRSELSPDDEFDPHNDVMVKPLNFGQQDDCFFDIQWYDAIDKGRPTECANASYEDRKTNAQYSSCSEDDAGSGATSVSSLSTDSVEFDSAHRKCSLVGENDNFLDCSPRRQVPIGPNHQASLPPWVGSMDKMSMDAFASSSAFGTEITAEKDENFLGKAVVLMHQDSNLSCDVNQVGDGRSDCNCADCGSIRCVRQHVKEARENLRNKLGLESFVNLGFSSMGEEVACSWSEEEEDAFHEVVYSYPASMGRNFWRHFRAVFPSRTKKELVSYYFNVFMLRRRATQNRIKSQNIDSDDDDFHGGEVISYPLQVSEEEEDSAVVSLDDQDVHVKTLKDFSEGLVHDEGKGDCMDDVENGHDNTDQSARCTVSLVGEEGNADGIQQVKEEDFSLQDDSCTSFDSQNGTVDHCNLLNPAVSLQGGGFKSDCGGPLPGKGESNFANHGYFLDPCDSKDWYPRYLTGLATGVDFLPTSNIIEEIFGQGSPEKKVRNN